MWPLKRKRAAFDHDALRHKSGISMNPLQKEGQTPNLEAHPDYLKKQLKEWKEKREHEIARSAVSAEEKQAQLIALQFQVEMDEKQLFLDTENEKFVKEFIKWLQYRDPVNRRDEYYVRGTEAELAKYGATVRKGPLIVKGSEEWLNAYVDKASKYQKQLLKLRMGPHNAYEWNLYDAWLYYKYILHGHALTTEGYLNDFDAYFYHKWEQGIPGAELYPPNNNLPEGQLATPGVRDTAEFTPEATKIDKSVPQPGNEYQEQMEEVKKEKEEDQGLTDINDAKPTEAAKEIVEQPADVVKEEDKPGPGPDDSKDGIKVKEEAGEPGEAVPKEEPKADKVDKGKDKAPPTPPSSPAPAKKKGVSSPAFMEKHTRAMGELVAEGFSSVLGDSPQSTTDNVHKIVRSASDDVAIMLRNGENIDVTNEMIRRIGGDTDVKRAAQKAKGILHAAAVHGPISDTEYMVGQKAGKMAPARAKAGEIAKNYIAKMKKATRENIKKEVALTINNVMSVQLLVHNLYADLPRNATAKISQYEMRDIASVHARVKSLFQNINTPATTEALASVYTLIMHETGETNTRSNAQTHVKTFSDALHALRNVAESPISTLQAKAPAERVTEPEFRTTPEGTVGMDINKISIEEVAEHIPLVDETQREAVKILAKVLRYLAMQGKYDGKTLGDALADVNKGLFSDPPKVKSKRAKK